MARCGFGSVSSTCLVLAGLIGSAPALAQSNQALITGLESQIANGERTLSREPYLAAFCPRLIDGKHFFHRGRRNQGLDPVADLNEWSTYLKQEFQAGRITREVAEGQWKTALKRRDEVVEACSLNELRAKLASARAANQQPTGSAPVEMPWAATSDANHVLAVTGTLSGNYSVWQLTGTGVPSWNTQIRAAVQCTGSVSPGYPPKAGSKGTMKCHAQWTDQGKAHIWTCRGNGIIEARWSIGDYWFAMYPMPNTDLGCQGTITSGDGKGRPNMFGLMGVKSRLGSGT